MLAACCATFHMVAERGLLNPLRRNSSSEPLKAMAGVDSTNVPLPEDENDFDLFGPPDPAGGAGASQPQQPVPPGPAQQPAAAPASDSGT